MGRLLKVVTSRLFWSFIGITLLSLLIYIAGPMIAFNDYHPLESQFSRIVLIIIIYVIWLLCKIAPKLYSSWLNGKLLKQLSAQQQINQENKTSEIEDNVLIERFNEAITILKKAKLNHDGTNKLRWYDRFSNQYIYQLPWYVIIGAPGSGKTTALINSGLHFPLAEQYGKTALRGVGGTRNCDWWFTNEAILLDTAGRYTMQESHQEKDASEWLNFVSLLKKYRSRQPINGIIMTISIPDLLNTTADERRLQAVTMRTRLKELYKEFGIYFPVYVMVTKADLLVGFMPYFERFDKNLRSQIWGFTFLYDEMQQPDFKLLAAYDKEYDLLQQRLESALPETMYHEHDLKKRAEIYQFPQQFAQLKGILRQYIEDTFSTSRFDETTLLPRGIYLTSGTQDNLDQLKNTMWNTLSKGIPYDMYNSEDPTANADPQNSAITSNSNKGHSYFLKGLLQNVIFKESGLAGNNRWWVYRTKTLHWIGYIITILITLLAFLLWMNSYNNNKTYLKTVEQHITALGQQNYVFDKIDAGEVLLILPYLNNLSALASGNDFDVDNPPWSYRFGLYRGKSVKSAANALYRQALQELLLPQAVSQAKAILKKDRGEDPDFTYEALKAYLMFHDAEHYDGKYLHNWLMANLQNNLDVTITRKQREELSSHYYNLLTSKIQLSTYEKDNDEINLKRNYLNQKPLSTRIYSRLKRVLQSQNNAQNEISLTDLAGPLTDAIFKRTSGKPNNRGVSGLYTPKGYWDLFDKNIEPVASSLNQENAWVLNSTSSYKTDETLFNQIRKEYMHDYIKEWDSFLADIQLIECKSVDQLIDMMLALSNKQSPLRELAINATRATTLKKVSMLPTSTQLTKKVNEQINSKANSGRLSWLIPDDISNNTSNSINSTTPEDEVSIHFRGLHMLTKSAENQADDIPFDSILPSINAGYAYLIAVKATRDGGKTIPESDVATGLRTQGYNLPVPFKGIIEKLAHDIEYISIIMVTENIEKKSQQEIGQLCRQTVMNRYPLSHRSSNEITPDDMAAMFAPQSGILDQFYQANLAGKVNTLTTPWSFRLPKNESKPSSILLPFQQAAKIRSALFANNSQKPSFQVYLQPVSLDNDILSMTLNINGQIMTYSHGPRTTSRIEWPGQQQNNQVIVQFSLVGGRSASTTYSGYWALHRMYDKAYVRHKSGNTKLLTLDIDGHRATIELTPSSAISPFELPVFNCP